MQAHAQSMTGVPVRVEHNTQPVGKVLSAWVNKRDGSLFALAELNTKGVGGALTAAAVQSRRFGEFSLGMYSSTQNNKTPQNQS